MANVFTGINANIDWDPLTIGTINTTNTTTNGGNIVFTTPVYATNTIDETPQLTPNPQTFQFQVPVRFPTPGWLWAPLSWWDRAPREQDDEGAFLQRRKETSV